MDIATLRRDMAAIDGGRWVAANEIPALQDIRIRVKGLGSADARDALAKLQRDGMAANDAIQAVTSTVCLLEIDGLTSGGDPVTADDVRDKLADPAMEPLALLVLRCIEKVDATREAKAKALAKN
jgi:hypothetical protein